MTNRKYQISNIKSDAVQRVICHLSFVICYLLLVTACTATVEPPAPVYLKAAGSTAMTPLLEELAAAFHERQPQVTIDIDGGGSALGRELAAAGQVDLGLTSWLPGGPPAGTQATLVARDGIALIVHPTNPITGLSQLQLRDVFHGRASAWSEVGGRPDDIAVITRERGADSRTEIEQRVLEGRNVTLNAIVAPSAEAMVDMVSTITTAVGYVSMGYRPAGVKMIAVEGVWPTPFTAADRTYPINRPVYFVALQEPEPGPNGDLRDFVAWVLSPDGQRVAGQRYGRVK